MKPDDDLHELTAAEIARQIEGHHAQRNAILKERAAIYRESQRNPSVYEIVIVDDDERAARQRAKTLLNGSAPASLALPMVANISRDRELAREQRAIDIVLDVLNDKQIANRATEAVAWAEANGDEWRARVRDIVLTATKLAALHTTVCGMIAQCADIFAVHLPMINVVEQSLFSEQTLNELHHLALSEGIITKTDIRKAATI